MLMISIEFIGITSQKLSQWRRPTVQNIYPGGRGGDFPISVKGIKKGKMRTFSEIKNMVSTHVCKLKETQSFFTI